MFLRGKLFAKFAKGQVTNLIVFSTLYGSSGGRFDIFALFRKEGGSVYDVTRRWPHALANTWKYILVPK